MTEILLTWVGPNDLLAAKPGVSGEGAVAATLGADHYDEAVRLL